MRKVFVVLIIAVMSLGLGIKAFAASLDQIKTYIDSLKVKITQAQSSGDSARVGKLQTLLKEAEASLEDSEPKAELSQPEDNGQLADYQEEVNASISQLKSQIDKVSADNKDVKVGGLIFFRWQKYTANGGTNVNNFDIDRAYLDFKKKLAGNSSARITLDISRLGTDSKKNLFDYLKYAYVEVPLASSLSVIPASLTAKIGLQHTVWIDWDDKVLGLRWIAKSLVDNEGVMSSSDFGLGALGKVSVAGLPEIEYHGTLINGAGYASPATASSKDLGLRLNSTLFSDETLGKVLFGIFGNLKGVTTSNIGGSNQQYGSTIALTNAIYTIYLEALTGKNSSKNIFGYSLGGKYEFLPGFTVFARADQYNPDTSLTTKKLDRSFYGIIYSVNKDVQISADMQNVTGGSSASTSAGKTTSVFYLHTQIVL